MTLEKARELIAMHVDLGSGYNRNAARMVLGEVMRDYGQEAVDQLIRDFELEQKWEIKPGTHFESAFKN
jgi:hypothetical protein